MPAQQRQSTPPVAKLPPYDVTAEEAVLAALMLDDAVRNDDYEEIISEAVEMLRPVDFFREQHGWVFSACLAIRERGEQVTWVAVAHELERMGVLESAGGVDALTDMVGRHFTAYGTVGHARIVARCALYRRLISAAGLIAQVAYEANPDADRVVNVAREALERALDGAQSSNVTPIYERDEYRGAAI